MDGLRGLAITLVVLFHYWQLSFWVWNLPGGHSLEWLQYPGFLGVELFFFISAFCLFLPYASGRVPSLRHFYYRRAIKIIPSYLLALAIFGWVIGDLYPSTYEHGKLADLGIHVLFLQNFGQATHGSFNGVLWSLAVEVQFYLLFPALAWLFRRRPFITAALMIAVAVGYRAWNRSLAEGLGIYVDWLPAYLDLFAFGMLAAWVMVWVRARPKAAARARPVFTALAIAAFALVILLLQWANDTRFGVGAAIWQSENRVYLGAAFTVLAVASAYAVPLWRAILGNRVLVFLSAISYNLYIWHQGIGILIRKRDWWPADTPVQTDDPTWRWTFWIVAVGSSIIVATLITYLFERPLLRNGVGGSLRKIRDRVSGGRGGAEATPEGAST